MKYIEIEMTADELKALKKVERAGGGMVNKLLDVLYGPVIDEDEDNTEEYEEGAADAGKDD